MIASYFLDAAATHGLEELAAEVLGAHLDAFRDGPEAAATGATLLHPLAEQLRARLRALEVERLFYEVEMPLARVLASMERRGMLIDVARPPAPGGRVTAR